MTEDEAKRAAMPEVGKKIRLRWGHGRPELLHVRAHVDGYLVMRSWSYRWKGWRYRIEGPWWWEINAERAEVE
jgi:hypothetical protein